MGTKYHAVLSPGLLSGRPRRQPPRKADGAVWWFTVSVGPFYSAAGGHGPGRSHVRQLWHRRTVHLTVAVVASAWHGAKVQPWEDTPVPANPRQPTLTSPPCATWVTGRLSLLLHRLADIQGAEFHPAARENAWWYQVYVWCALAYCMCNGRLSKVLGIKSCFLLMSYRTWELRRQTSAESQWNRSF